MLSYQHAYHAGGPADLHKHLVLAALLAALLRKPRALTYAETHAGRGLYDLGSPQALKTGEAAEGVGRLAPDPATPFGGVLARVRARHGAAAYPGSPLIAREMLRPTDRLLLAEKHPAELAALRDTLTGPGVEIIGGDGLDAIWDRAPPQPRRGLVLIDPSWEVKEDYTTIPRFARALLGAWPEVTVMIWYPLLPANRHFALHDGLADLRVVRDEVAFDLKGGAGMRGSGIALVNAPHGSFGVVAAAVASGAPVLRRP